MSTETKQGFRNGHAFGVFSFGGGGVQSFGNTIPNSSKRLSTRYSNSPAMLRRSVIDSNRSFSFASSDNEYEVGVFAIEKTLTNNKYCCMVVVSLLDYHTKVNNSCCIKQYDKQQFFVNSETMFMENKAAEDDKHLWKPVVGYEGLYEVSKFGSIRSIPRYSKRNTFKGRILKPFNSNSYLRVVLSKKDKNKNIAIHRVVAMAWLPNHKNHNVVNHKDGNKHNNNADNLEWCDNKWNTMHASVVLGVSRGERNANAKLTKREVDLLRYLKARYPEISSYYVADFFSVSDSTINAMWNGKTWNYEERDSKFYHSSPDGGI